MAGNVPFVDKLTTLNRRTMHVVKPITKHPPSTHFFVGVIFEYILKLYVVTPKKMEQENTWEKQCVTILAEFDFSAMFPDVSSLRPQRYTGFLGTNVESQKGFDRNRSKI